MVYDRPVTMVLIIGAGDMGERVADELSHQYGGADVWISTGSGLVSYGVWSGAGFYGHRWYVGDFDGNAAARRRTRSRLLTWRLAGAAPGDRRGAVAEVGDEDAAAQSTRNGWVVLGSTVWPS